jgi:hypothetical protein
MMALANLAGGFGAYLALARASDSAEAIVHQAVAERTLKLRREREEAQLKYIGAHIDALGKTLARIFGA